MPGEAEAEEDFVMVVSEDAQQGVSAPETEVERLSDSELREMPLHEAVLADHVRGWRIWESIFHRDDYDETSPVFQEKLDNLVAHAKIVEDGIKRGKNRALTNLADLKPRSQCKAEIACFPLEHYMEMLKKDDASCQTPEGCGSENLASHTKASLPCKAEPEETSAMTVSEKAAQQVGVPDTEVERHCSITALHGNAQRKAIMEQIESQEAVSGSRALCQAAYDIL
ncbi:hypothetical protein COCOBI_11-5500 [Coccomyxa sp. Obi]|nr:hypothetical protein COCOBI_11-5500 [Coccomyxa sp. Obi]